MLRWIAEQVSADSSLLQGYAERDQTRREHFIELLDEYGWRSFGLHEHCELSTWLMNQARSTDQGMALVVLLIGELRHRRIIVPVLPGLEPRTADHCNACLRPSRSVSSPEQRFNISTKREAGGFTGGAGRITADLARLA
jgi:hypothetical protein